MLIDQPPAKNGIMEITEQEKTNIKSSLLQIQTSFEASEDEPELTTHGLVTRYNYANPTLLINGDTAEYVLSE